MASFYSGEMLETMARQAETARPRLFDWMARQTLSNMRRATPDAIAAQGGEACVLERLRAGYEASFDARD